MMNRRDFLQKTSLASGLALTGTETKKHSFRLAYAPHFGMFENSAGKNLIDQLKFMADAGFTALEDNDLMPRSTADQQLIGETLAKLNMKMGVFVIDAGDNWKTSYTTGKREFKDRFFTKCRQAVETAKRSNATYMTVVPGYFDRNIPIGIQTGNVIDLLREAAEIFEPHGLVMVLEPLSDTPELFLRTSDQTYGICRAVDSPSCKILYDIYHMQWNEGNILNNIDAVWKEIAYFQIGDNPHRKEPGTGEINYQNVFKHIHSKMLADKKSFIFGMEHGNAFPGKDGESRLIEAYKKADAW